MADDAREPLWILRTKFDFYSVLLKPVLCVPLLSLTRTDLHRWTATF